MPRHCLVDRGFRPFSAALFLVILFSISAWGRDFKTIPMATKFLGEEKGTSFYWNEVVEDASIRVRYLSEPERAPFKVTFRDGLLVNSHGVPLDSGPGDDEYIFVMDEKGDWYATKEQQPGAFHHSSFLAGGRIAAAGEIYLREGRVIRITNLSGHYPNGPQFALQALQVLTQAQADLEHTVVETYDPYYGDPKRSPLPSFVAKIIGKAQVEQVQNGLKTGDSPQSVSHAEVLNRLPSALSAADKDQRKPLLRTIKDWANSDSEHLTTLFASLAPRYGSWADEDPQSAAYFLGLLSRPDRRRLSTLLPRAAFEKILESPNDDLKKIGFDIFADRAAESPAFLAGYLSPEKPAALRNLVLVETAQRMILAPSPGRAFLWKLLLHELEGDASIFSEEALVRGVMALRSSGQSLPAFQTPTPKTQARLYAALTELTVSRPHALPLAESHPLSLPSLHRTKLVQALRAMQKKADPWLAGAVGRALLRLGEIDQLPYFSAMEGRDWRTKKMRFLATMDVKDFAHRIAITSFIPQAHPRNHLPSPRPGPLWKSWRGQKPSTPTSTSHGRGTTALA